MDKLQRFLYPKGTPYAKIRYGVVANARWFGRIILPTSADDWVADINRLCKEEILALFRAMTADITVSWGAVDLEDNETQIGLFDDRFKKLEKTEQLQIMLKKTGRQWFKTSDHRLLAVFIPLFLGSRVKRCVCNTKYVETTFQKVMEFMKDARSTYCCENDMYRELIKFLHGFLTHAADTDAILLKKVLRHNASITVASAFKRNYQGDSILIPRPDPWVRKMSKTIQLLYIEQMDACIEEFYDTFNLQCKGMSLSNTQEPHFYKAMECGRGVMRQYDRDYDSGYNEGWRGTPFLDLKYQDLKSTDYIMGYRNGLIDRNVSPVYPETAYDEDSSEWS